MRRVCKAGLSIRALLLAAAMLTLTPVHVATAEGPSDRRAASVGYVYPAGGQQGTVVQVLAGGQNLRGVQAAHVSGEGVSAAVLRHVRALNNQQQGELRRRIAAIRKARRAAEAADDAPRRRRKKPRKGKGADGGDDKAPEKPRIELPAHPLLDRLGELTDAELDAVAARFLGVERRKKQPNAQLAETVEIEIEIAPGAGPGYREIRLETRAGLTNPVRFHVGDQPEILERAAAKEQTLASTPVVVNGQILPGEADRFRFRAKGGRRLVVAAAARDLVPFLADTVPGWFQATLSLRDSDGREVGFSDDFGFEPDPRLVLDVPKDGEYVVEIRDALYRGREDFVYRLSLAEDAPHAWTAGSGRRASADVSPDGSADARLHHEVEPNDKAVEAEGLLPPHVVLGRIAWPGDEDSYVFQGRAGVEVVIEVAGRRLGSPIDPVVRLLDPSGAVLAWSDDYDDGAPGLLTHHADCYLRTRLPEAGAYTVRVADVRGHGGARHDYRLRVGPPRPDFTVAVTPSSLSVPAGRSVPFRVHARRKDGFGGEIEMRLVDAPPGFALSGGRVPPGSDSVRMTLTAPRKSGGETVAIRLEARARIDGRDVAHDAVPADDRMQAFLYRHLVPAQELLVAVQRARGALAVTLATRVPIHVPAERGARVDFRVPGLKAGTKLSVRLDDPPAGVALAGTQVTDGVLVLRLRADADAPRVSDNLIAQVFVTGKNGQPWSVGYLPAIPIEFGERAAAD